MKLPKVSLQTVTIAVWLAEHLDLCVTNHLVQVVAHYIPNSSLLKCQGELGRQIF